MTVLLHLLLSAYCCFDNDREVAVVDDEDDVVVVAVKYEVDDDEAVATAVAEAIEAVQLFFLERLVLLE